MFKPLNGIIAIVAVIFIVLLVSNANQPGAQTQLNAVALQLIQQKADLVSLEIEQSVIVTRELNGYSGGIKACIVAVGILRLGSDLQQIKFEDVDEDARTAVLVLPPPRVLSVKVDLKKTHVYAVDRTGLWQLLPFATREDEVIAGALRDAEKILEQSVTEQHLEQAERHAEKVIAELLNAVGWRML